MTGNPFKITIRVQTECVFGGKGGWVVLALLSYYVIIYVAGDWYNFDSHVLNC